MATAHQLPQRDIRDGRRPMMRIPLWYKDGSAFRYNWRCGLGFVPGAILISVVCGKTFVATALFALMVNLLIHSLGYDMIQMGLTVASVFGCQLVNFYCMLPLMWHSVLNIPLFLTFHVFIVIVGLWGIIQIDEFRCQDPRVTLLAEKGLFIAIPAVNLVMISWFTGMLAGREYLPITLAITGIFLISLFIVPLQSSFVKPDTPLTEALILPRPVGLLFVMLIALLPGIVFSAIHTGLFFSWDSNGFLSQLFFLCPPFVLTLLETQRIFEWFGNVSEKSIFYTRWIFGLMTMGSLSMFLSYQPASTYLPILTVPLLFCFIGFLSSLSLHSQYQKLITLVLLVTMVTLILVTATQLPWNLLYNFTMLSVPLVVLQIVFICLSLFSLLLLLSWQKDVMLLWPTYHAIFVGCEFVINSEGFYSVSLLLVTAFAAVVLCLRLHAVGRLPLPVAVLCLSLHILKLSQLIPLSFSFSYLSHAGWILSMLSLLKLLSTETLSIRLFMSLCCLLALGLIMSIQSMAIPLLIAITHSPPTHSDLAAFICAVIAVTVSHFLPRVKKSPASEACRYLPPSLFLMAVLLWLLQPEFNPSEIHEAVGVVFLHHANVDLYLGRRVTTQQLIVLAWIVIMKWIVVLYAIMSIVSFTLKLCLPQVILQTAGSLLAASTSLLISLQFAHHTPFSLLGILYGVSGLIGGYLLTLVMLKKPRTPAWIEAIILMILCVLCTITLAIDLASVPPHVIGESVPVPSGILHLIIFACIAGALKIKSLAEGGQSFLPLHCNICCLLTFLLAVFIKLPIQLDTALLVSLASCVMLLMQADGIISRHKTSGLFLAPSLVCSSLTLFLLSFCRITLDLSHGLTLLRVLELICLLATVPGQVKFLSTLWKGSPLRFRIVSLILYILPNALLIQYGGSINIVLGSTVILCFSLLSIAEFQTVVVL